uniref:Nuclear protein Hcc-1 n=1 Tax=Caligus rogercresseyi TaxID=217165 RepID=C1BN45_CALRO|nr:Nuclear protein Hcc-1 [Caligus rogercresseyi]|eukprot:TRINITY_DN7911_c0_g1_i1.p1 TRINITY_DN7911_c0_g1~~TRINITY_DN7911_c0_g1_i1.p1  ORF type:complete len:254 (-),score=102.21 TRINITY_DN7911_c0_g1_i1:168-929(-)
MSEFDSDMDINSMKVTDLKKELRKRGLSAEGKKQELLERLLLDDSRSKSGVEEILGEEEADNLLNAEDEALGAEKDENLSPEPPKKKVAINRDINIPSITTTPVEGSESEVAKKESDSKLSDEDRSQARKEPFGSEEVAGEVAVEDKKAARAARFGLPPPDMNKLKQRSERFGQVNSSAVKKMEDAEKIKKRQERFGVVTAASQKGSKAVPKAVLDPAEEEKRRKRAERFGLNKEEDDEKKKIRSLRFGVAAT